MKFDELDREMRQFETGRDEHVPDGGFIVARMDGRGFTRLTKEVLRFEAPYDERFRDAIAATASHLMNCGFRALHAYCQSDEISLLLHPQEGAFQRKERKLLSVLAGEASAAITHALGQPACMDSRLCLLPDVARVADYFRWRMEDARRNCLNSHAYWLLRRLGQNATSATRQLSGLCVQEKGDLLAAHGIVFQDLPAWQRLGFAVEWQEIERSGTDPRTGAATTTKRRRLHTLLELPEGPHFGQQIDAHLSAILLDQQSAKPSITATPAEANHRWFDQALPTPIPGKLTLISGAQTGVDRAALDAALALGFPCSGWVPSNRTDEAGEIPAHYPVTALTAGGYAARTNANLKLADGTVIIYHREPEGGTAETVRRCRRYRRPHLLIDAAKFSAKEAAEQIKCFVEKEKLQSLNIAGPRASKWAKGHGYALQAITLLLRSYRG